MHAALLRRLEAGSTSVSKAPLLVSRTTQAETPMSSMGGSLSGHDNGFEKRRRFHSQTREASIPFEAYSPRGTNFAGRKQKHLPNRLKILYFSEEAIEN